MLKQVQPFSRRGLIKTSFGALALAKLPILNLMSIDSKPQNSDLVLWYREPAAAWTEALPVGNGRLGAMVFGGVQEEHLQLNEATLWGGGPHDYDHPDAASHLAEIRKLIFEEKFKEAQDLTNQTFMSQPIGQMPYQSLGDLFLKLNHPAQATEYSRTLDLENSVAATTYKVDGVRYNRSVIASHPDQIVAVHLEADRAGKISFEARFESPQKSKASASSDSLKIEGISSEADGIPGAVRFAGILRVKTKGGTVTAQADHLVVSNADSATLYISLGTSYKNYDDVSGDPVKIAEDHLARASTKPFKEIQTSHSWDYRSLFNRVSLNLGHSNREVPTDQRIHEFANGEDPGLATLYFQYGRYLLISASRPGGAAATLQGLWNDSVSPPWGSKYTININTEMNYWMAECCALSECHEPLFAMVAQIAETGRKTAKVHYNAKGWVTHHNTDGWRGTAPIDGAGWGNWPTGGAWLCTHLWQHYLFTLDKSMLSKHYPVMKGAAEFFVDSMVEYPGKGWLVTSPSASPEHEHHSSITICAGPAMDSQIIRDLFEQCIEASNVLDTDPEFREQLKATLKRLAPMQIGKAGQLQEWIEDWDLSAPEIQHRHVSHLYALHPSNQITPEQTPELANACRKTLEIRGDAGTGWSLAWKINFWARLHDGNHAHQLITDALRPEGNGGGGVYKNLFDAHPPFQIDGNFGFSSGICEMLLQSHDGTLHLLPALPDAWPKGSVTGLRGRGGLTLDLVWDKGELKSVNVTASHPGEYELRYKGKTATVELDRGHRKQVFPERFI